MKESINGNTELPEERYRPATIREVEDLIYKLKSRVRSGQDLSNMALFKSRFNRLKKDKEQGIITAEVFQVELNRLRLNLNDSLRV